MPRPLSLLNANEHIESKIMIIFRYLFLGFVRLTPPQQLSYSFLANPSFQPAVYPVGKSFHN